MALEYNFLLTINDFLFFFYTGFKYGQAKILEISQTAD
jgi:hypothetical protein